MDVVELIDDVAVVVGALVPLPRRFVGHGVDLYIKIERPCVQGSI